MAALLMSPSKTLAQDQRAILEVVINGVASGETMVVLRAEDALVGVTYLREAGLRGFAGRRETGSEGELVSLASLAPQVHFSIDEENLKLTLDAHPDLLGRQVRNLWNRGPADLQFKADTSGFVNYSVNYRSSREMDLYLESAVRARGVLFHNSASATNRGATRGLTSIVRDDRPALRRWTFGDSLGYSGALGGDTWLGGVTVSREFAIDPYFVRHPTLSLSTPITVPSIMEVRVNGQIVDQQDVAPGRIDVQNLPLTLGRNDAQIVIRDAFGGTRELSSTYYLTSSALAPGVHDFQYSAGFRRRGVGSDSWNYGAPVALARHRVGLSSLLTLGGRAELDRHTLSGGPTMNLRLPFGEIEGAASLSRHDGHWGAASLASFTYTDRQISAGGSVTVASREHATLTERPEGQDPATQAALFASTSLGGPISLTLQQTIATLHQGASRWRTSLLSTIRVHRHIELNAIFSRSRDENGRGHEMYANLTFLLGRVSASTSQTWDTNGYRTTVDAQQPLPAGEGYGFQMHAEAGEQNRSHFAGVGQYQGAHGRYELRRERIGGQTQTTATAAGAIVGIGGRLFASRPIYDSFALIRVPGVGGVSGFASNQKIGETNKTGDLLVPDLQAYYGNTLRIADSDIPLQYAVPDIRLTLAPPYRGGAVALFPVAIVQRIVGKIRRADDTATAPAYGDLTVKVGTQTHVSPVGGDGSFYLENIPAGTHPGSVESGGSSCAFALVVPASDSPLITLPAIVCTYQEAAR